MAVLEKPARRGRATSSIDGRERRPVEQRGAGGAPRSISDLAARRDPVPHAIKLCRFSPPSGPGRAERTSDRIASTPPKIAEPAAVAPAAARCDQHVRPS